MTSYIACKLATPAFRCHKALIIFYLGKSFKNQFEISTWSSSFCWLPLTFLSLPIYRTLFWMTTGPSVFDCDSSAPEQGTNEGKQRRMPATARSLRIWWGCWAGEPNLCWKAFANQRNFWQTQSLANWRGGPLCKLLFCFIFIRCKDYPTPPGGEERHSLNYL